MILYVLSYLLLGVMHMACFSTLIEPKYSAKKTAFIYVLAAVSFALISAIIRLIFRQNIVISVGVSFTVTFFICFAVFMATSTDPFCKKLFLYVNYGNLFCIFCCMAIMFTHTFFYNVSDVTSSFIKIAIMCLLFSGIAYVYLRFLRPTVRELGRSNKRAWYSITLMSLLFLVAFSFMTIICRAYFQKENYVPLLVILTAIYVSSMWVTFGMVMNMKNIHKMTLVNKNMEYLQKQLEIDRQHSLEFKKVRHDYKHHCDSVSNLIKNGNTEEALMYIDKYKKHLDETKPIEFCSNVTVNAVLNNFYIKASEFGIPIKAFIEVPAETTIAGIDLVAVISNLLENAVNGCLECESREEITVNIRTVAEKLVIVCSNPCKPDIDIESNMLKNKGIGIESILSSIHKYNGEIHYEYSNGRLTACVLLKI